jgi:hypothetical protein
VHTNHRQLKKEPAHSSSAHKSAVVC